MQWAVAGTRRVPWCWSRAVRRRARTVAAYVPLAPPALRARRRGTFCGERGSGLAGSLEASAVSFGRKKVRDLRWTRHLTGRPPPEKFA